MGDTVAIEGNAGRILPRLRLMRLPNAITAVADVIAGGALAEASPKMLIPLALSASLLYAGGCVLNDLADRKIDESKHPHRPLPLGIVLPKEAGGLAALLFCAGVVSASASGVASAAAAGALLGLILLYDLVAKRHSIAGPLCMGSCRAAAVLLGMSVSFPGTGAAYLFPGASLLYVLALTRLAQYEKCAPAHPPKLLISAAAAVALVLLGVGFFWFPGFDRGPAGVFLLLFLLVAGGGLVRGLGHGPIGAAVGQLILAIPLLDAVAAAGALGWGTGAAAALCALPPWWAKRLFYIT